MSDLSTSELQQQAETPEEVYQRLVRALKRKQGFGLFFVQCTPSQRQEIVDKLAASLSDKQVKILAVEPGGDRLYDQVEAIWETEPFDVLVLQGLELEVLVHEDAKRFKQNKPHELNPFIQIGILPVLHHLNQQRERFRDNFPACFVLLLPSFMVDYFIQHAPDFFDWRSGVLCFPTDLQNYDA